MVRGGHNFKVDYKVDIKRVLRGVTREYSNWSETHISKVKRELRVI